MWFARERIRSSRWTFPEDAARRSGEHLKELLDGAYKDVMAETGIVAGASATFGSFLSLSGMSLIQSFETDLQAAQQPASPHWTRRRACCTLRSESIVRPLAQACLLAASSALRREYPLTRMFHRLAVSATLSSTSSGRSTPPNSRQRLRRLLPPTAPLRPFLQFSTSSSTYKILRSTTSMPRDSCRRYRSPCWTRPSARATRETCSWPSPVVQTRFPCS